MQFRKEWVIPTAVGVGSLIGGAAIGYGFALTKVVKGSEKINEYLSLVERQLEAAETRVIKLDEIGYRLDRLVQAYERLYENHRDVDGTQQNSDETEQNSDGEESETARQLSISFDPDKGDESNKGSTTEIGFAKQNELKKQAVMAHIDSEEEESMVNVFRREVDENWDWDEEMEKRKDATIYILHKDEYEDEELAEDGFNQSELVYYGGDGILCDERGVPIYEKEKVVGELVFGRGSGDSHICYVRNENLRSEFCIELQDGWFGKEVLGQHLEDLIDKSKKNTKLEHSVPKFRQE